MYAVLEYWKCHNSRSLGVETFDQQYKGWDDGEVNADRLLRLNPN